MEGLELRELSLYEDNRGWLGEIIRDDESDDEIRYEDDPSSPFKIEDS